MKIIVCFFLVLGFGLSVYAQDSITIGHKISLESKVLDEKRELWIYTPPGYEEGEQKYPVMYLLDGDGHFHHTTGLMNFLRREHRIPPMIVVAILNTNRTRDLTPKASGGDAIRFPDGGGADQFLTFISDELFPFVEEKYRAHPYRLLVGHSFGGLFAAHTILSRPKLFNSYLAISPSLWWDEQSLLSYTPECLSANSSTEVAVFIAVGKEGEIMESTAKALASKLKASKNQAMRSWFHYMGDQGHANILHLAIYKAMELMKETY